MLPEDLDRKARRHLGPDQHHLRAEPELPARLLHAVPAAAAQRSEAIGPRHCALHVASRALHIFAGCMLQRGSGPKQGTGLMLEWERPR